MRSIYVEKNIPRVLLTKAVAEFWPGFVWTPLSAARAGSLVDRPLPGPRWVRVQNIACGICATDLSLLYMRVDPSIGPAALPGRDHIDLGHEAVGRVIEAGAAVRDVRVGDRVIMDRHFNGSNCLNLEVEPCEMCAKGETVFCYRNSAEPYAGIGAGFGDGYIAHESSVHVCPRELSLDQAVLVEPLAVGAHAVLRHVPRAEHKVLVIGAGMIGLSVVMALRAAQPECEISVLARYPFQAALAESFGARHIIAGGNLYLQVANLAGGKFFSAPLNRGAVIGGFDMIFDCVGDARTVNDALRWVKAGGKIVLVGAHLKPMPKVDLVNIWYHQVELVGVVSHGREKFQNEDRHTYDWVYDFMRRGMYPTDGIVTHRFGFDEFKTALHFADEPKGKTRAVKVVMQTADQSPQ